MIILEIQPTTVHLIGLTRSASFKLKNKNQFLAISYSFDKKMDGYEQQLQIFPEKGILLRGQQQKIRIKPYHNNNDSTLQEIQIKVYVRYTLKIQYNKQYLKKNNLKGWNQISDEVYIQEILIVSGGEREVIENYIKEQIVFNKAFGPEQLNISAIKYHQNQEFDRSNLDIQSKICQDMKNQSESIVKPYNVNNSQVSIDIDHLLPLDFGQSRASPMKSIKSSSLGFSMSKQQMFKMEMIQSRIIQQQRTMVEQDRLMRTAQQKDFILNQSFLNGSSMQKKQNRALDIILLAIISAFFVALGNNIGRLFK